MQSTSNHSKKILYAIIKFFGVQEESELPRCVCVCVCVCVRACTSSRWKEGKTDKVIEFPLLDASCLSVKST